LKTLKFLLIVVVGIVLAFNAFLLPFQALAFSTDYYVESFTKLEVHNTVGITTDSLFRVTDALVTFIDNGSGNIKLIEFVNGEDVVFYNEKEQIHLNDIRLLVQSGRYFILFMNALLLISLIFIIYQDKKEKIKLGKNITHMFKAAFFATIAGLSFLIALYFIDFNWAFTKFHEIFFTNDLWLLNPKTDRLIQLMPLEFFIEFVAKWLSRVAMILGVYVLIGFILPILSRAKGKKI